MFTVLKYLHLNKYQFMLFVPLFYKEEQNEKTTKRMNYESWFYLFQSFNVYLNSDPGPQPLRQGVHEALLISPLGPEPGVLQPLLHSPLEDVRDPVVLHVQLDGVRSGGRGCYGNLAKMLNFGRFQTSCSEVRKLDEDQK